MMLDIHSHIIPHVDDGAYNIEQTKAMLRMAMQVGVKAIIATPHIDKPDIDRAALLAAYKEAADEASQLGIHLLLGYEYHYRLLLDDDSINHLQQYIGDTNILLLEFSNVLPQGWENIISSVQQAGIDVIIAHPERYVDIQQDVSIAERMVQLGCDLQIDAESLDVGAVRAHKKSAKAMLKQGLVHWIASDAHNRRAYKSFAKINVKYAAQLQKPNYLKELHETYKPDADVVKKLKLATVMKKTLLLASICIAAIAAIIVCFMLYQTWRIQADERAVYDNLRDLAATTVPTTAVPEATSTTLPATTPIPTPRFDGWYAGIAKESDRVIDFDLLQEINPDCYAWITIEGTDIDYPLVHTEANSAKYLDYDFNGNKSAAGAIYTDGWNSGDLSDPNTLIYGHNMKNGTMFAQLHRFKEVEFFSNNPTVKVYLPDGAMLEYTIFAAYTTGAVHILVYNDFRDPDVFGGYLRSVLDVRDLNAHYREVQISAEDDRIITLITCVGNDPMRRLFIQAVLNTNEDVQPDEN